MLFDLYYPYARYAGMWSDNRKVHKCIILLLPPEYAVEVMFSSCLCVCVCLSVRAITFEPVDIEISFFGVVVHLDNI